MEQRLATQVARVRRVDVVLVAVARVGLDLGAGARRRTRAGVFAEAHAGVRLERRQAHAVDEVVAVLVVVGDQADEVAIVADRLIDPRVVLLLVDLAGAVEDVVLGVGVAEPGAGAPGTDLAGVDHREEAAEVFFTVLAFDGHAEVVVGLAGHVVHRAAGGRSRRAVDVGRALVDVNLGDQLRVHLLVRIDRVVAAVVQRDAVLQQRHALRVETADVDVTTGRAEGVVVGEVDARQHVQRVQNRLARDLAGDEVLRDARASLRHGLGDDGAVLVTDRRSRDDHLFDDFGAGRLGHGRAGCRQGADQSGRRQGEMFHVHLKEPLIHQHACVGSHSFVPLTAVYRKI